MGRRTRKKRLPREERVRGEARNEQIRAELEPLAPGERPTAVTVAAIVALVLAVINAVTVALGRSLDDDATTSAVGFSIILLVAAIGMWKARYWAVLGFQALLGIQVSLSAIAAMFSNTVLEAVTLSAAAILGGWLFWKLVRALARLQMPERRVKPPVI